MGERKIHESCPPGRHMMKVFNKEQDGADDSGSQKPVSPRRLKVCIFFYHTFKP